MECVICKEELDLFKIVELECNHKFHQKCIFKWVNSDRIDCPCCRKLLLDIEETEPQINYFKSKLIDFWEWMNNEIYSHRPIEMILIMSVIFLIGMVCAFIIDHPKHTSYKMEIDSLRNIINNYIIKSNLNTT
jgi:hypothetical protein